MEQQQSQNNTDKKLKIQVEQLQAQIAALKSENELLKKQIADFLCFIGK